MSACLPHQEKVQLFVHKIVHLISEGSCRLENLIQTLSFSHHLAQLLFTFVFSNLAASQAFKSRCLLSALSFVLRHLISLIALFCSLPEPAPALVFSVLVTDAKIDPFCSH